MSLKAVMRKKGKGGEGLGLMARGEELRLAAGGC
jgi:hypothetical protein